MADTAIRIKDTLAAFIARVSGRSLNQIQVIWDEDEGRKSIELGRVSPVSVVHAVDSTGQPRSFVDTSGRVTEASAAGIATHLASQPLIKNLLVSQAGIFSGPVDDETQSWRAEHLRMAVTLTTNVGGEVLGPLVSAVGGYKSCMIITHVFALGTDGAWDLDIEATSGIALGPHPMVGLASVANQIGPDWPQGLAYKATAANEAISAHITNGGNAIAYTFFGWFWHEAT